MSETFPFRVDPATVTNLETSENEPDGGYLVPTDLVDAIKAAVQDGRSIIFDPIQISLDRMRAAEAHFEPGRAIESGADVFDVQRDGGGGGIQAMIQKCDDCGAQYDDALCTTVCPHEQFISESAASRKDRAMRLCGRELIFSGEGGTIFGVVRIESIDHDGWVSLVGQTGLFDPQRLEPRAIKANDLLEMRLPEATFTPALEPGADVFDVHRATMPAGKVGIYVLTVPSRVLIERIATYFANRWEELWRRAGAVEAPQLMVLGNDMELRALGEAELERMGLMRIPSARDD